MKEKGNREQGTGIRALCIAAFAALAAAASFGATASMYAYTVPAKHADKRDQALGCLKADEILAAGGKLELGKWYTNWEACKKYADENGVPVFFIWSNHGCIHCWYTDSSLTQPDFIAWKESNDAGKVIYCFMSGGESGCPDQSGSAAYNWMWKTPDKLGAFPFVTLYWKGHGKDGVITHESGGVFCGTKQDNPDSYPTRVKNIIAKMESAFAGWHPEPDYEGGWFTQTNYPYATPQAESTTEFVDVRLRRTSTSPASQVMKIAGKAAGSVPVSWVSNQFEQVVTIANFTNYFNAGADVTLQLMGTGKDSQDQVMSETKVYCFKADEEKPSADNPRWAKDETINFGEWTMNLDKAKETVNQYGDEKAYTLVLIAGSLWCPDCYNVDHKFLNNPKFTTWATSNNVALVQIDLPPLTGGTVLAPTLLSRTEGTGYFDKDGKTGLFTKSGVGYLTRKMQNDAAAEEVLERNRRLVTTDTAEGGFRRPGDGKYRPGVPYFLMLRKDGTVAARLTQWAVSTKDLKNDQFDNYLKRFDEMLQIADKNLTEIENNDPTPANTLVIAANGDVEPASISHTDPKDVFRLGDLGGNALQAVRVTGSSDAKVVVSFLATNSTGEVETLATATNTIKAGVSLTNLFTRAGDYFVRVEAEDITSPEFAVESASSTFQDYTVTADLLAFVPQEDRATAKPKAGSSSVRMKFEAGEVYRIGGMGELCGALTNLTAVGTEFFMATNSGIWEVKLTGGAAELTYQKWVAGTVGFAGKSREVDKSDCDMTGRPIEIPVVRSAKSGRATVTVVIDTNNTQYATLFDQGRIWITNGTDRLSADLSWEDGDEAEKNVQVWIEDDLLDWDEISTVLLRITNVTSEVEAEGFAVGIDEENQEFKLMVSAVITGSAGSVVIDDVTPGFARGTTVYLRQSEELKLTASREGGNAHLVAALIQSSYDKTEYKTDDPRDLSTIEAEHPSIVEQPFYEQLKNAHFLWWANRETSNKTVRISFPGLQPGQSARIQLLALEPLENAGDYGTLTVYIVGKDVPGFVKPVGAFDATDYMAVDQTFALTNVAAGDKTVRFSKMSGTLPSGLKVSYDETIPAMRIAGITKAKAGVYPVSYVVSKKVDGKTVTGTTLSLDITVWDLKQSGPNGEQPNAIVMKASRTFKGIAVIDPANSNMVGTLQVTVPPSGRASARFNGADGTVSFSAKGWTVRQTDGTLETDLEMRRGETTLHLAADPDGGITAQLEGGAMNGFAAYTVGKVWSKLSPADAWVGQYTVALIHTRVAAEDAEGLAPTGNGWITLKMTESAARRGTFTAKGWLPNGTRFSGSYPLQLMTNEIDVAYLPVFYRSSRNVLAAVAEIAAGACSDEMPCDSIRAAEFTVGGTDFTCDGTWIHREPAKDKAGYEVRFDLRGACYNADKDLRSCLCTSATQPTEDVEAVFLFNGKEYPVTIQAHDIKSGDSALTLEFEPSNGTISGSADGAAYSGIVVIGDIGCPCKPGEFVYNTFAYGGAAEQGKPVAIEKKSTPSGN